MGCLTATLRGFPLHGLSCSRHKTVNYHGLSGHHVFTTVGFGFGVIRFYNYFLGYLNRSLRFSRDLGLGEIFLNNISRFNRSVS